MQVISQQKSFYRTSVVSRPIKTVNTLVLNDILDLLQGKFIALQVTNYYPKQFCSQLCQRLLKLPSFARYLRAPDVGVQRTGITLFETKGNPLLLERYYAEAQDISTSIREACFPYLSPIDKLRVELEELWPVGARLENIHGHQMMVGIVRAFEDSYELPPHQDIMARDIITSPNVSSLLCQLSANVYLQKARFGGELEIWRMKPSYAEFEELCCDELHFDRAKLPLPEVFYKPSAGDLVLFDSRRVHAVRPSENGPRVSMSCFIGYQGQDKPLTYWS